jgi:hypothetical protein
VNTPWPPHPYVENTDVPVFVWVLIGLLAALAVTPIVVVLVIL